MSTSIRLLTVHVTGFCLLCVSIWMSSVIYFNLILKGIILHTNKHFKNKKKLLIYQYFVFSPLQGPPSNSKKGITRVIRVIESPGHPVCKYLFPLHYSLI